MLFTGLFIKVLERMLGRKLAAMIAATSGDGITERTVRNWITLRTAPDPERLAELHRQGRMWLDRHLAGKDWPASEREVFQSGLNECPGMISGFVFSMHKPHDQYPASLHLARRIDLLDRRLDEHRVAGDLDSYVGELLRTDWLCDEHFVNPDNNGSAEATRRQLREATSWEDLTVPLAVILANTQFELLATLDLELCARYLEDFEAEPIFVPFLPRLAPGIELEGRTSIPTSRDMYHYPVRRLLDTMACMSSMRRNGKWPPSVPTVKEMAIWLELAGEEKLASNLVKWRMGRPFTMPRFFQVWEALFAFLDKRERPPAPAPMMYAVSVFTELFVKGSREDGDLTFMVPDPAFYRRWWDIQRQKLQAEAQTLRFGSNRWMPGLL